MCVREPIMDPVLDVCEREPIMDPVLDVCEREPSLMVRYTSMAAERTGKLTAGMSRL